MTSATTTTMRSVYDSVFACTHHGDFYLERDTMPGRPLDVDRVETLRDSEGRLRSPAGILVRVDDHPACPSCGRLLVRRFFRPTFRVAAAVASNSTRSS